MNRQEFLKELRQYGIENTVPNISDVNVKFLRDLIKISKSKTLLEIGTANGFSAINFADELEKVDGEITTIDFSPKSHQEALENFKEAGVENMIKAILGNALDEIPKLKNNSFDFVFIDGMMRRSKDFLELCWSKTKAGGIIIIDDVIKFKEKMVGLWEYLEENNIKYNVLPIDIDDGVMMIIKNGVNNDIFDKWNINKKKINNIDFEEIKFFREREIWFTKVGQNIGIESFGKGDDFLRPVLIIKKINKESFIGIPTSTKGKAGKYIYKTKINGKINYFNFSQIKTYSSKRLLYIIGKFNEGEFINCKIKLTQYLK